MILNTSQCAWLPTTCEVNLVKKRASEQFGSIWLNTLKWTRQVRISKLTFCYFLNGFHSAQFWCKQFWNQTFIMFLRNSWFYWWSHDRLVNSWFWEKGLQSWSIWTEYQCTYLLKSPFLHETLFMTRTSGNLESRELKIQK